MFGADRIVWKEDVIGIFTIKSTYLKLHGSSASARSSYWKAKWEMVVPQHIRVFLWLALRARAVWLKLVKPERLNEFNSVPFRDRMLSNLQEASRMRYMQDLSMTRMPSVLRLNPIVAVQPGIVGWQLPRRGWVRLKVDDVVCLVDGVSFVVSVIRSDCGAWPYGFARSSGKCSIDARRGGVALVIVIQEFIRREWEVELSYVPLEFNTVADKLASIMCGQPIGEISFEVMPTLVSDIVVTEALLGRLARDFGQVFGLFGMMSVKFGADRIVWKEDVIGIFTIKSTYLKLHGSSASARSSYWKAKWEMVVPQHIRVFLWLALRARAVWLKLVKPERLNEFNSVPFRDRMLSNLQEASRMRYMQDLSMTRMPSVLRLNPIVAVQPGIVGWQLPRRGWVRLNVDDVVCLVDGVSFVVGVIRSDCGAWPYGFARSSGKCSIDARRGGVALVIVIQEFIRREWEVELSYVPLEFNTVADKLALIMCGQPIGEISFEVMPTLVSDIVVTEALLGRLARDFGQVFGLFGMMSVKFGADRIVWKEDVIGIFTIKSTYLKLHGSSASARSSYWKAKWEMVVPQHIRVFLWLALRARAVWLKLVKPKRLNEFNSVPFRDRMLSNLQEASRMRYMQDLSMTRMPSVLRLNPIVAVQPGIVGWQLPRRGWVRLNVDDVVCLVDGVSFVVGVIRSDCGAWPYGFARSSGKCSIDARRGGVALVIVIQEFIRREWEVELSYVPLEFNTVADKLASIMCGQPIGEISFEVMPTLVSDIVVTEALLGRNLHENLGG
ncbi:hypothetical protein GQ457_01G022470 [Hibiscus cannabinus]